MASPNATTWPRAGIRLVLDADTTVTGVAEECILTPFSDCPPNRRASYIFRAARPVRVRLTSLQVADRSWGRRFNVQAFNPTQLTIQVDTQMPRPGDLPFDISGGETRVGILHRARPYSEGMIYRALFDLSGNTHAVGATYSVAVESPEP